MTSLVRALVTLCLAFAVAIAGHSGHAMSMGSTAHGETTSHHHSHGTDHTDATRMMDLPNAGEAEGAMTAQHTDACAAFSCGAFLPDQPEADGRSPVFISIQYRNIEFMMLPGASPPAMLRPPRA